MHKTLRDSALNQSTRPKNANAAVMGKKVYGTQPVQVVQHVTLVDTTSAKNWGQHATIVQQLEDTRVSLSTPQKLGQDVSQIVVQGPVRLLQVLHIEQPVGTTER